MHFVNGELNKSATVAFVLVELELDSWTVYALWIFDRLLLTSEVSSEASQPPIFPLNIDHNVVPTADATANISQYRTTVCTRLKLDFPIDRKVVSLIPNNPIDGPILF